MQYSFEEYADMHLILGKADGNAARAVRLYSESYPNRRQPCAKTFLGVDRRLRESGSFTPRTADWGRNVRRNVNVEEQILDIVEENPEISVRRISAATRVKNTTAWTVLREQQLYPYHIQRVQALEPVDNNQRLLFSQFCEQQLTNDPDFTLKIIFTDEACFTRDGVFNFRNSHVWSDENPHAVVSSRHQRRFSINIWCGIIGNQLLGPCELPNRLNGNVYANFLQESLPVLLENVPLATRLNCWFMHDGAPAHFPINVRNFLNNHFPQKWIGRGGPVAWPARSPDMNPLDYYLWGHLKSIVYARAVDSREELLQRIHDACEAIRNRPEVLERACRSLEQRVHACIQVDGSHFEQLL